MLTDLAVDRAARKLGGRGPYAATIRSAPASETDMVYVSIDRQGRYRRGPCPWGPPRAGRLPQVGDAAKVSVDDAGDLWVDNWWPQ